MRRRGGQRWRRRLRLVTEHGRRRSITTPLHNGAARHSQRSSYYDPSFDVQVNPGARKYATVSDRSRHERTGGLGHTLWRNRTLERSSCPSAVCNRPATRSRPRDARFSAIAPAWSVLMSPSSASGHGPFARVVSRTREVMEPILADRRRASPRPREPEEAELHLSRDAPAARPGDAAARAVPDVHGQHGDQRHAWRTCSRPFIPGISQLQWVINGYALVFASFMLLFGTLGDQLGRKKVMLSGVILFCCGSVVAAVAANADTLIAGRVIMGLGAAASEPGTLSMIRHLYPERRARAKALGIWAAVSGLALAMGPLIGGVLVGVYSFRAVFWFNLFFGLVALVGAALILPESVNTIRFRLDFAGFLLGAGASRGRLVRHHPGRDGGLQELQDRHAVRRRVRPRGLLRASTNARRRTRSSTSRSSSAQPLPVATSSRSARTSAPSRSSSSWLCISRTWGRARATGPRSTSLPMAAAMIIASLLTGRWVARSGPRLPMTVGCVLAGIGIILTEVVLTPSSGLSTIGWTLPIAGAGFGIAIVPVTSTALSSLPAEHSGMAASATNTSRELGAVAGVAILGSMVNGQLISSLVRQLNLIGIPKSFQDTVITAVTTGTFNSQAEAVQGNAGDHEDREGGDPGRLRRIRPRPGRGALGGRGDDARMRDRRRLDDACTDPDISDAAAHPAARLSYPGSPETVAGRPQVASRRQDPPAPARGRRYAWQPTLHGFAV